MAMFPYPSGKLHMGHARVYTISDVLARSHRMMGYNVLHPMGWDAFGLPAENAAIERKIHPSEWTNTNIEQMKQQLKLLQFDFDWDRELTTCDPEYYKWTQWLFIRLFKSGLAYQQEAIVNWDPVDQTVLANEQVDANGRSWRSGAQVEKRKLKQWFFKIREFAEPLLEDLKLLTEWPEQVKKMQEIWIGRSFGAEFTFTVPNGSPLTVFTTRPETIYGVTYIAISRDNIQVLDKLPIRPEKRMELEQYIQKNSTFGSHLTSRVAPDTSIGLYLGIDAIHPLTNTKIPIYVAEYVVADFAYGCVMAVPAHDDRDKIFAKAHNIHMIRVIDEEGFLMNSEEFNGMNVHSNYKEICHAIITKAEQNNVGKYSKQYRLRDWLVSRQRYWGTPIPIIHCPECGPVPVREDQLPVKLPEKKNFQDQCNGIHDTSPLAKYNDWINVKCPCNKGIDCTRDTDTMDTFVDSSWYFLRYATNPKNRSKNIFDQEMNEWMNVDYYIGGIEHAVLHLLYARFIQKFLYSQGFTQHNEPFKKLLAQGMVHGKTFKDPITNRYLKPDEPKPENVNIVWEKMSKSKYNGIDPSDVVNKYGADVVRLFILFMAPFEKVLEWDEEKIIGQVRFLTRLDTLFTKFKSFQDENGKLDHMKSLPIQNENGKLDHMKSLPIQDENGKLDHMKSLPIQDENGKRNHMKSSSLQIYKNLVKQIRDALTTDLSFNTCISNLHKYSIALHDEDIESPTFEKALSILPSLLAPFAPETAEKLFQKLIKHLQNDHKLKQYRSVHDTPFPTIQDLGHDILHHDVIDVMIIAVNGKKVGELHQVPITIANDQKNIENYVRGNLPHLLGTDIVHRVIIVSGKMVNFVK